MMSSHRRAGKTAPRFLQDIELYDPVHPPASGRNLLVDIPPVFPDGYDGPPEWLSPSACKHVYVTKPNQTIVVTPDQRQGRGAYSKVCAVCSKCRLHAQVVVNYTANVAPTSGHLHHLVCQSGSHANGSTTSRGQSAETFYYKCSYLTCGITVSVQITSPVLNHDFLQLLTDVELVNKRADEAIAAQPERLEGIARPQPITILDNLRTYLRNSLQDPQRSKPISAINKRFVVCFGVDGKHCKDLLEFLGFSFRDEGFWDPPDPKASEDPPFQNELNIFLDNVIHELSILIEQRPVSEKKTPYALNPSLRASNDFLNALEAANYAKSTRLIEFEMPGQPCYEDLGTVEDMASDLIIEAYHRQVAVDPSRGPHYLQCLSSIAQWRGGPDRDTINEAVTIAYSRGAYTTSDIFKAYEYFDLNPNDTTLTDDVIIGRFHAYLSSTTQETEARQQLWRIGDVRESERIKSAAEDRVSNAEQALVYLGVEENTPDDFVITMFTTKVNDSPSSREISEKALSLIAEKRNSETLKHFLKTGETGAGEMDVGDAYRLLQIPDRTVGDDAILAAYTICVDEAPTQVETYTRALSIIAKEKDSPMLSSFVSGSTTHSDRVLSEWPVGLQNIGNTCYLNSLLQFYFTVRPYREMVLDFENNKTDLDEESLRQKKVGSRKVSRAEVERSQKFLRELRGLFHNMITTSKAFVRPEQELARLTLISSTNEAEIRRRSTISGIRPFGLGEINGAPVAGPLGPPESITSPGHENVDQNTIPIQGTPAHDRQVNDIDSETTLVSDPETEKDAPLPASAFAVSGDTEDITQTISQPQTLEKVDPPSRPPPEPPRPAETDRKRQLIEEVELGAQQDVTEVINNVLFQSECAIRPRGIAPDGEQLDQIKDLFYGKTKTYITAQNGTRSKEELWSDIKVDVATGSRDIYSAIDGAFDMQEVFVDDAVVEQFGAISKLPPVLQIQVQRVQFDPIKKTSFKSTHHLDLKETIYLDRYMDTQKEDIVKRRRDCWAWKRKLIALQSRKAELLRSSDNDGQNMPSLFKNASSLLTELSAINSTDDRPSDSLDINAELAVEMQKLSQITQAELAHIEQETKDIEAMISSSFNNYTKLAYRLYAVFMHQGSVEFGHYYIYIFDFKKQVWRKYNDNDITEVKDTTEIFGTPNQANPPTPYFLVYVNAAMKDRLVEPVRREIVSETNTTENSDVNAVAKFDGPMDIDVATDMKPPSYFDVKTKDEPQVSSVESPPSPVSPTAIPLKRKGSEDQMSITVSSHVDVS
ncbi:ubiquitin C-terminal hydrolase, putative [Talaromyces stipitatus ATCC 10500]|uniref:ubiquitinyl hydrolase 1 n=1 Tax=Talaromyces stipitatus (strain ATCC 10500 / CBS 375.48 / QM 6759 / NRRL 1006) TaxID=441959 RepID=B8M9A2_TALSN|nr:ubiquitin C-terminal hydrolase, putative [Talaromyces stipitatus ATCC 10500]EED17662.1 ubiquitin C-terminal hydrolase, putative [Talaromyces stipitatus ATCC 10500]